jgi:hypothetical protein
MHGFAVTLLLASLAAGPAVVDDAHVLAPEQVAKLEAAIAAVPSCHLAIALTATTNGQSMEDFGAAFAAAHGLDLENGKDVLIAVAVQDHHSRIVAGAPLRPVLTEALRRNILDTELAPAFRSGDYGGGLLAAVAVIRDLPSPTEGGWDWGMFNFLCVCPVVMGLFWVGYGRLEKWLSSSRIDKGRADPESALRTSEAMRQDPSPPPSPPSGPSDTGGSNGSW